MGTVRWINIKSGKFIEVRTNRNGAYVSDLPAGTYRVEAGIGSGWPMDTCNRLLPSLRSAATLLTLRPGQHPIVNVACDAA
jgi:hypothetical protein